MNADAEKASPEKAEHHKKEYHYFVDGKEYTTEDSALTGAQIKARIPDFNPAYQLNLLTQRCHGSVRYMRVLSETWEQTLTNTVQHRDA